MAKYLVTGGRQRVLDENIKEWKGYDKAVCILFDSQTQTAEKFYDYTSPRENLPADPEASITFKSASLHEDNLIVCTTTEVLSISLKDRKLQSVLSLPVFNDVHHAFVNTSGNFVVASTGLDAVFEINQNHEVVNEWNVLGGDIWSKFDREIDYRHVLTTKPHASHPNHCTEIDGQIWVTRLDQSDYRNLQTEETISIPYSPPHDGLLIGDEVYFTHVRGAVSKIDLPTRATTKIFDATLYHDKKENLGWCRGLCKVDADNIILGFTRVRPTKYGEAYHWLKRNLTSQASWYGGIPTRLVQYDIKSGEINWEFNLEPFEINAVFSILPID